MADGFLGRWSRRKLEAKEGRAVEEPVRDLGPGAPPPQPSPGGGGSQPAVSPPLPGEGQGGGTPAAKQPAEPPPTLDDAKSLTPESDFSRFVRPDVAPEVKNAALKKLFADPRFNIQDGLDVYIDDYNKPDPMPEAMLRKLAGAKFLGLFREEERTEEASAQPRDDAEGQALPSVAQSQPAQPADGLDGAKPAGPTHDADPDLRLQQDDAAEGGESGRGPR
jgi:hypothetical protein